MVIDWNAFTLWSSRSSRHRGMLPGPHHPYSKDSLRSQAFL